MELQLIASLQEDSSYKYFEYYLYCY